MKAYRTDTQFRNIVRNSFFYKNYFQVFYLVFLKHFIDHHPKTHHLGKKNRDLVFYIITTTSEDKGIFEKWLETAAKLMYAEHNGYIPCVDVDLLNTDNPDDRRWDKIYVQPQTEYTLDEIKQSYNVIYSDESELVRNVVGTSFPLARYNRWLRGEYHRCFKRMGYNPEIMKQFEGLNLPPKTLGVPLRRLMEYLHLVGHPSKEYFRHHVLGYMEDYIKYCHKALDKKQYEYLFVTSDDREGLEIMKREFGNKCLFYDRPLVNNFIDGKPVPINRKERMREFKAGAMENVLGYILETQLLSKCHAILYNGFSQGIMADIMSDEPIPLLENDIHLKIYR